MQEATPPAKGRTAPTRGIQVNPKKAGRVCMEILQTEESFVQALTVIEDHYLVPLQTSRSSLISPDEHRALFGIVSTLRNCNLMFLRDLRGGAAGR